MNDSSGETEQAMTTLSKTLLAVSVTGFVAGSIIDFGGFNLNPAWTVALPVGAIFFGLFLISFMMEKEMAKFDEEESMKMQLVQCISVAPAPKEKPIPQSSFNSRREHYENQTRRTIRAHGG
jgi:hypothetical protein